MSSAIFRDLVGRVAVVSGSSSGIGRAVAVALTQQGCSVYGLDAASPPATSAAPAGAALHHVDCDLRDPHAIERAVGAVPRALDYLVNVAGVDPKYSLEEGDAEAWARVHDVNLRGQYLLIRACAPLLERGEGRAVVNVASLSAFLGVRRRGIYSASKAGVLGLTTGLARDLGDKSIRINSISPGWVFTAGQIDTYFSGTAREENEAYLDNVQSIRGKRIAPPEVASTVLFLLSDAASAVSGSNLMVDAGWRLQ